jgi:GH3 auxin-responsive promoter
MANLALSLVSGLTRQVRTKFVRQTQQCSAVQENFLRSLLHYQQQTVLGQEYGLSDIQTIDQFRDRVPILPYSSYEPYMERIAKGEPNILTPDPVAYLNLTSGSTGKQKLIPTTQKSRQVLGRAKSASIAFSFEALRRRNLPPGKMLLTSSVQLLGHTASGIPFGPVSVGDLRLTPFLQKQLLAHPYDAMRPTESLARHYMCILFALRSPHIVLGANFPILALRLCDYMEQYAEDLIQDMESGAIAPWLNLSPELRQCLEKQCQPNPKRAAQLRHILKTEGRLAPKFVWQNMPMIITARGGTSDFYFERFPHYFGDTPIFGGVYASAESTFGVYPEVNQDGSILALDSGFFEFIPEDQWSLSEPKTLLPCEVTPGERYRILVTNYSGLYRYDIGDVVEVLGFYNETPLIVFRHRLGGLLSSTTEKTTEFHAVQVMQRLQQRFQVSLENFCITLSDGGIPSHYWVNIELAPGSNLSDPEAFIRCFDDYLKEIHISYEVKRRDQVPPPRLRLLAPGSFATVRQQMVQRGIPESQLKFPHISENRMFLSGLTVEREVAIALEKTPVLLT